MVKEKTWISKSVEVIATLFARPEKQAPQAGSDWPSQEKHRSHGATCSIDSQKDPLIVLT